jgi:hypothetical protein
MPTLSGPEIAAIAHEAKFSGDALVTALAISKAESGWRTDAHCLNCAGVREDSRGLWQINVLAHPQYDKERLLTDPLYNAQAAYAISGQGHNFRPWSTYYRPTNAPRYKAFLPEAKAAADTVGATSSGGGGGVVGAVTDAAGAAAGAAAAGAGAAVGAVTGGVGAAAGAASKGLDWLTGGAIGAVKTTGDAALTFARFLGAVANPDMWRRLGLILVGGALVVAGFALINRDALGAVAKEAISTAGKAAVV